MADECLFCKIVKGDIPCHKIVETDKSLAFLDIYPTAPDHALVIPKEHAVKMHELSAESLADLLPVAKKVATAIGCTDYNVLQNNGEIAHQVVKHVHVHIIPKPSEEKGLGVQWPSAPADHAVLGPRAAELAAKISE